MTAEKKLAVIVDGHGDVLTPQQVEDIAYALREANECAAWDAYFIAALRRYQTHDFEVCARVADAMLEERRKRWGGS